MNDLCQHSSRGLPTSIWFRPAIIRNRCGSGSDCLSMLQTNAGVSTRKWIGVGVGVGVHMELM